MVDLEQVRATRRTILTLTAVAAGTGSGLAACSANPLDGNWRVTGARGPDASLPAKANMKISGDKVTGYDSVNAFQSHLVVSGDQLSFEDLAVGAVGTVGDAGAGATFFHTVIGAKPRYRIDGQSLILSDRGGRTLELARQ
ncbi:META domain-containing protein [Aestuariimicrobium sp. T2.26MG-19.2B]|uniref:META domain-containing protein n=1 Tax=Aestuariimicrobium sp. T2.26MG-19.2B TaxID=3040679 RepID=UPI0024779211|nr:META domain-containing protein [Aestuariimicrobium sp. T2.26MG-19.2B]CAI9409267.1 hypothetical protein AESSP_02202 [Aestuariimicrobium sp. T2.26MG-19.2B]